MAECQLPKLNVGSSILLSRSILHSGSALEKKIKAAFSKTCQLPNPAEGGAGLNACHAGGVIGSSILLSRSIYHPFL